MDKKTNKNNNNNNTTTNNNNAGAAGNALSKNISLVLENLLQNYENTRPPFEDRPTVVQTNILIRSMGPISELDMDYSMDCYFRQKWRDERLSFPGSIESLSLSIQMLERIWRPDTYFYNGKHSYVHTITVPNKLLRLSRHGDILYSMRLTIKAKCPMELHNFPMDDQSCPLVLGSYSHPRQTLVYEWQGGPNGTSVDFVPGMTLSQFHLMGAPHRNLTLQRRHGEFSVLQVSFNLRRSTGFFLIQTYVPCVLIVVLSWVSFWIHREATSDRVGLGITTVLTLSTISLDSRTDLPKVRYATALDWFLLMSFFYCVATLLQFAGVHYFTKVGSGEVYVDEDEWETLDEVECDVVGPMDLVYHQPRRRSSLICPIINDPGSPQPPPPPPPVRPRPAPRTPRWKQLVLCLAGDEDFRRERQRQAQQDAPRHVNSVSRIDRAARVVFPASFGLLNLAYWVLYGSARRDFAWTDPPVFLDH